MDRHYLSSSFRENLVEHLFVSELLKLSWQKGDCSLEIAKPEVDNRGYDLIAEQNGIVRHIQLKSSHLQAKTLKQKANIALTSKPSGCVIWVYFNESSLELGPFLFFGGKAGEPLPSISGFKIAKHTKANAKGFKAERPEIREIPKSHFQSYYSIAKLYDVLFVHIQSRNEKM